MTSQCKHGMPLGTPCVDCGGVRQPERYIIDRLGGVRTPDGDYVRAEEWAREKARADAAEERIAREEFESQRRCVWCRERPTGAWINNYGTSFCDSTCETLWTAMVKQRLTDE